MIHFPAAVRRRLRRLASTHASPAEEVHRTLAQSLKVDSSQYVVETCISASETRQLYARARASLWIELA